DTPVAVRRVKRRDDKAQDIIVVDLHASELLDDMRGLSNADILNYQVDRFREVMDANARNKGQRIVFIHGKGEGVLRQALMKELNHRYKGHQVQDASFREYGFGATQVTI
ncbi:MAG: Smr/MutS family protein, partial [Muribaculaceae bacterium]|nr:Smr/MutS family protein [Muribaculaceae bacterium]